MNNFREMMRETYPSNIALTDLRAHKMQMNISSRIESIDERRLQKSWLQLAKVAAVFLMVFVSYYLMNQGQTYMNDNQLFAKIDQFVNEVAEQKQDVSNTIITYQTQEDMYLELMNKRLAKLQDKEKETFLKEIF